MLPQICPLFKALGRPLVASEFTVSRIRIVSSHRLFNISRAKADLHYYPVVCMADALQCTLANAQAYRAVVTAEVPKVTQTP